MNDQNIHKPYYDLNQLIPFDIIKQIHENFYNASHMNFVIQDNTGRNLINNHKYLKFCNKIKDTYELYQYCRKTTEIAKLMAYNSKKPIIYKCYAGFVLIAVPLLIEQQSLGTIFSGQVLVNNEELNLIEQFYSVPTNNFLLDQTLSSIYYETRKKCKFFSLSQLKLYANFLYSISNYIAQLCHIRIINNDLNYYKVMVQQKEKEISLMKFSQTETKIKSIQANMNSKFIFNSLNNINCMAILEDAEQTSDLIVSLSNLIKGHLNRTESFISFEKELEYIKNFIKIKQLPQWNKINVKIDIDSACLVCKIPPLCLYAFVENAFIHGLEPKEDIGHFNLSARLNNNKVYIEISDDGLGINHEILNKVTNISEKLYMHSSSSLGIRNAISILKFYYGNDFYWDITSIHSKGTTIKIIIPYIT